ncbi:MAG: TadE/TadG family type IV pilus assembly protein [Methylococcaceae bacterium]
MAIHKKNFRSLQKGAVLVEFAIVVPLLLLLVVGISEFGYAFYHLNILNKSVQDGARYFSNPQIARYDGSFYSLSYPINISNTSNANGGNAPYILKMQNLVIYGNIAGTGNALMPPDNGSGYTTPIIPTIPAANHIQVTVQYNHNFILGNVLNNFLGITNPFPLTASSVLRVE